MKPRSLSETQCDVCHKKFLNTNSKVSLQKHKIFCNSVTDFMTKYEFTKESLSLEIEKRGSLLSLIKDYPHWKGHSQYYRMLKFLGIEVSCKKSSNNESVKNRRKENIMQNYGVEHNFSKGHPSRDKWEKTLFDKEGITNVFQRESVKQKSLETFVKKYETERWLHGITVRGQGVVSKLNKKVFDVLEKNDIKFCIEFKVKRDKTRYYSYDILIEDSNKIIEINGDYWHGNPLIYKPTDILLKGSSKEMLVSDKWDLDKIKIEFIKNLDYSVLIIWEKDIKDDFNLVIDKILKYAKS